MRFLIAAGALMAASTFAGAASPVLGLPLGGSIKIATASCPIDTQKARQVCWIGKPFVTDSGARVGSVHIPDPDSRPLWAAYAQFKIEISPDNVLDSIEVRTFSSGDRREIAQSIAQRFGAAEFNGESPDGAMSAQWKTPEVSIAMLCDRTEFCAVTFRSARSQSRLEQRLAERQRANAARPATP